MSSLTVLTCGSFDLFHIGHLNLLLRAKKLGEKLIVGVSSDFLNVDKKDKLPIIPLYERYKMLKEIKCVDQVFIEDDISLEAKSRYMEYYNAEIFVMGDDWVGRFDDLPSVHKKLFPSSKKNIQVLYINRTPYISTTSILTKLQYRPITNFKQTMLPKASNELLNFANDSNNNINVSCIFHCRNQPHQAVHLLPYYYLLNSNNVYWFIEMEEVDPNNKCGFSKVFDLDYIVNNLSKYLGFTIDKSHIITQLSEIPKYNIKFAMFTEIWKPFVDFYSANKIKTYFIDHGICVGTRPAKWFAHKWQDYVDKNIVSGDLQYDYHLICAGNPECHNKDPSDIVKLYGCPRYSLYNPCEWIWNINSIGDKPNRPKILIAPTSFYDNYELIIKNIVKLCKIYTVIIRPHPITHEMANPASVLLKIFNLCIETKCADNLIIIPPGHYFYTMNLFTCDMAIFDQSSVAYEYLLENKPGIIIANKLAEDIKDTKCSIIDAFVHSSSLAECKKPLFEYVLRDPKHLKEKRENMITYTFGSGNNSEWMGNFINIIKKDLNLDSTIETKL